MKSHYKITLKMLLYQDMYVEYIINCCILLKIIDINIVKTPICYA